MRHCSVLLSVILFTGFFLFSVHAQAIDLTGTVKDASTKAAISGAKVSLTLNPGVFATTDAAGAYHLQNVNVRFLRSIENDLIKTPFFNQNSLFFGVSKDGEQTVIELYSLSGRRVASLVNTRLSRGNYRIDPFAASFASQVFFVKVRTDSRTAMFKMPFVNKLSAVSGGTLYKINGADARNVAAKSAAVKDTIEVLAQGHKMGVIPNYRLYRGQQHRAWRTGSFRRVHRLECDAVYGYCKGYHGHNGSGQQCCRSHASRKGLELLGHERFQG